MLLFSSLPLSLFKILDAFENEMAKKVKLQNVLSQLRKCVDHPYLFHGETLPFFLTLFFVKNFVKILASIIVKFFKRIAYVYYRFFSPFSLVSFLY